MGSPANPKIFLFFTLRAVDELLRFTYSGGNFLHSGNFQ
ncbi:dihydrofolate reductase [Raoultella sp. T31]|nr:dihydrofolate reductase [Raoultella sp. T31]